MIKIVLADDHEIIRKAVPEFLKTYGIQTVATAKDGEEAVEQYKKYHPDVIVLDLEMPKKDGLLAARNILYFDPAARIVVFSGHLHTIYISVLKELGVIGFVRKEGAIKELVEAIQCNHRGEVYYCADSTRNLLKYTEGIKGFNTLSVNEKMVTLLLAYSMSLENIAKALSIARVTARTHKRNAFKKLGIQSNSELYTLVANHGIYRLQKKAA